MLLFFSFSRQSTQICSENYFAFFGLWLKYLLNSQSSTALLLLVCSLYEPPSDLSLCLWLTSQLFLNIYIADLQLSVHVQLEMSGLIQKNQCVVFFGYLYCEKFPASYKYEWKCGKYYVSLFGWKCNELGILAMEISLSGIHVLDN